MKTLLPGLDRQLSLLKGEIELTDLDILVIGSSSEEIAKLMSKKSNSSVELIVEDYDSLINSKLLLGHKGNVNVRIMDFETTDFDDGEFDLVYAQASISSFRRNKIVKEIKRILKPEGFFCVGEVTQLSEDIPVFVREILDSSDLEPLQSDKLGNYFEKRNFQIIAEKDLSPTLKEYYSLSLKKFEDSKTELTDDEKKYYKKLLNRISHESNAFLKLGADKFIGFKALLMKKGSN